MASIEPDLGKLRLFPAYKKMPNGPYCEVPTPLPPKMSVSWCCMAGDLNTPLNGPQAPLIKVSDGWYVP